MKAGTRPLLILGALVLGVMVSAVAGIYAKHQSRKLFVELQALVAERDHLEMDWGRLQIEQSTQSSHARVEQVARERMAMRNPDPNDIQLVAK